VGVTRHPDSGLTIAHPGCGKIHYRARPEGLEWPPFVEALLGPEGIDEPGAWAGRLAGLERPADLLVFIGAGCPHCPGAARAAIRLALASPGVTVTIADVHEHEELARRFKVQAVPYTVLDGGLGLSGVLAPGELAERILGRDDDRHRQDLLRSLVEQGRMAAATEQLRAGPDPFLALWQGSATSLRIGLMMAVEEALEEDRAALDGLVPGLLAVLQDSDDLPLRGDTADLLGRIGHPDAAAALQALAGDPNPDLAEIATEALEEIESRSQP
jgi:hypothetical protein